MRGTPVIPIAPRGSRRRTHRAAQARRRLDAARRGRRPRPLPGAEDYVGGRAWINGEEVGGPAGHFAHLAHTHD